MKWDGSFFTMKVVHQLQKELSPSTYGIFYNYFFSGLIDPPSTKINPATSWSYLRLLSEYSGLAWPLWTVCLFPSIIELWITRAYSALMLTTGLICRRPWNQSTMLNHRLSDSLQLHLKTVIVEVVEIQICALISVTPADQSRSQYQCFVR